MRGYNFQYGVNTGGKRGVLATVNAAYMLQAGTNKLTLKTGRNYCFWPDTNYTIYYLYEPEARRMRDFLLMAKTHNVSSVSEVVHSRLSGNFGFRLNK
jgi:hypothetical protein